jgi:alpha-glucosidase
VTGAEKIQVGKEWEEMFHYQHDMPEVHQVMRELRQLIDEYDDRVLVGETDEIAFYGNGKDELHLNFNFPLMRVEKMTAEHVLANQKTRFALLPENAWPCNTLGNHDCPRMHNQFGDGVHDDLIARQNLVMLLTLKGTPFLYYGEEIGMTDLPFGCEQIPRPLAIEYTHSSDINIKINEDDALKNASRQAGQVPTPKQCPNNANVEFHPRQANMVP